MQHAWVDNRRTAPPGLMARRSSPRRALVAACIGNMIKWYDFALYGAFATVLASTSFPRADEHALLFGRLGNRRGRRQVLAATIVLMSVATAAVGLLPGYVAIGSLAPVLLIVLRVLQGVSAGGEAGVAAFVVEYAARYGADGTADGSGDPRARLGRGTGAATLLAWRLPRGMLLVVDERRAGR